MLLVKFIYFLVFLKESHQSHWRGGFITWAPVNNAVQFPISTTEVVITQQYFDKYGYGDDDKCASPEDIANKNLINKASGGLLKSTSGPDWSISTQVYCYSYSMENDWQSGRRDQTQEIITDTPVSALFNDAAWLSGVILTPDTDLGNNSYFFELIIDLKKRTDTGKINTSPSVNLTSSTLKLSNNCGDFKQSFQIPVSDVDGDIVKCRCRNNICHQNLTIDSNCTIFFSPESANPYAIYITVEDFAPSNPSVPLSSIPILILALVSNSPADCSKLFDYYLIFKFIFCCN
jgi:hypothetical protein